MRKYNPKGVCIKCGGTDISSVYHEDFTKCGWSNHFEGEHIHRHCRNCGYEWPEKPSDAKEAIK